MDDLYLIYPELCITTDQCKLDFVAIMQKLWDSRAFWYRVLMKSSTAVKNRQEYELLMHDQVCLIIRLILHYNYLLNDPVESGAFIHSLVCEQPKVAFTLGNYLLHHYPEQIMLAVEHVPSMTIWMDRLPELLHMDDGPVFLLIACLACKYPSHKTIECAEKVLSRVCGRQEMPMEAIRLILRAYPPFKQKFPDLPNLIDDSFRDIKCRKSFSIFT